MFMFPRRGTPDRTSDLRARVFPGSTNSHRIRLLRHFPLLLRPSSEGCRGRSRRPPRSFVSPCCSRGGGRASRCRVPTHPRALRQGQDFVQSAEMFCFTSTRFPRQLFLFHFLLLVLDRILHLQVFLCYSEDPKHDYVKSFPGFSVLFFLWVLLTALSDILAFSLNVSFGREVPPVTFPLCAFPGLVQFPPSVPRGLRPESRLVLQRGWRTVDPISGPAEGPSLGQLPPDPAACCSPRWQWLFPVYFAHREATSPGLWL